MVENEAVTAAPGAVRHTGTLQAQMSPVECPLPAAQLHMAHGALKVQ